MALPASEEHTPVYLQDDTIVLSGAVASSASVVMINQWKTHFECNYSQWAFFDSVRQAVSPDTSQAEDSGEADCSGTSIHQTPSLSFGCDWRTGVLSALPPRNVIGFLTSTYFRFAQSGYFCIHPEIFSRKLVAFYDGVNEFAARDAQSLKRSVEFISVLFMVLAIGSQFAEVGDPASDSAGASSASNNMHDSTLPFDLSQMRIPAPSQNPGWQSYQVSRRLLPDILCSSSITSVQVCILQGLFLPSTTSRDASYNMLGLAMRMAINMGLHRSFHSYLTLNTHVRELRNRLWWSVYVADRLYTTDMGRPLSINDAEVDAPLPQHMPEWTDEATNTTKISIMTALVRLCRILGRIMESIYCNGPFQEGVRGTGTIIGPRNGTASEGSATKMARKTSGSTFFRKFPNKSRSPSVVDARAGKSAPDTAVPEFCIHDPAPDELDNCTMQRGCAQVSSAAGAALYGLGCLRH
ncbi:fungal-specific transcription factor domain-containing protein [Aspergillus karnatakaensis]|uniref:fungal specific transcription factor domain-containing protein n=1 Tax=Aspergillus karnatakaensis TaxID=1810916 RepID=UPI003CCCB8A3